MEEHWVLRGDHHREAAPDRIKMIRLRTRIDFNTKETCPKGDFFKKTDRRKCLEEVVGIGKCS